MNFGGGWFLFKLSNIEIISWSRKTLHLIFLKYWVGHFFMKGVDKDDGTLSSNSVEQNGGTGFNSIYKTIPLFTDVRFLMGKWNSNHYSPINFWVAYLLTINQLIMLKTKKKTPIRKAITKIPWQKSISLVIQKKWCSRLLPV